MFCFFKWGTLEYGWMLMGWGFEKVRGMGVEYEGKV